MSVCVCVCVCVCVWGGGGGGERASSIPIRELSPSSPSQKLQCESCLSQRIIELKRSLLHHGVTYTLGSHQLIRGVYSMTCNTKND